MGNRLVSATHRTTLEITKENHLTPRGSCIIAIRSEKGARDLSSTFKEIARKPRAVIVLGLECDGVEDTVVAHGSQDLTFTHPTDIVFRTSDFVCSRTVAIQANKSASLLKRSLITELQKAKPVHILLEARVDDS